MTTTTTTTRRGVTSRTLRRTEVSESTVSVSPVASRSSSSSSSSSSFVPSSAASCVGPRRSPTNVAALPQLMPPLLSLLLLLLGLAPRGATAQVPKDCNAEANRGWLDGFFEKEVHPTGLFGTSGIHGETLQINSTTSKFDVKVKRDSDSAVTYAYRPGASYFIDLDCGSNECAFFATVEAGPVATSGKDKWRGTFLDPPSTTIKGFEYSGQPGVYGAAHSSDATGAKYFVKWRAPANLTYAPLSVRVTVVVDETTTCEGFYREIQLASEVVCGDGDKDVLEHCDDGNLVAGDGCDAGCAVELGWSCDELYPGTTTSKCTQATVVFEPAGALVTVEEGSQVTYNISLSIAPVTKVRVVINSLELSPVNPLIEVVNREFEFQPDGALAWNKAQTVTVTTTDNDMIDGPRNGTLQHRVISDDPNYKETGASIPIPTVTVTVTDNDEPGLLVSKRSLTVDENGLSNRYTVRLRSQPVQGSTLNVVITSPSVNQLTITPSRIFFTTDTWNQPQVISVFGLDNEVIDGTVVTTIDHAVSPSVPGLDEAYSAFNATDCCQLTVTVLDNDSPGISVLPRSLTVTEGQTQSYQIYAQTKPDHTVYVNFTSTPNLKVTAADGSSGVAIQRLQWDERHVVTVEAVDNDRVNTIWGEPPTGTVTHATSSADQLYADLNAAPAAPWTVQVTIEDDDSAGVRRPEAVTVTEGLTPTQVELSLPTMPKSRVKVYLSLRDDGFLLLEGADVTREGTGTNLRLSVEWEVAQWQEIRRVLVRRSEDDLTDSGLRTTFLQYEVESSDASYSGLVVKDTTVTAVDDDKAGVTVSPSASLTLSEAGDPAEVRVKLNTRPQLFDGLRSRVVVVRLEHDAQVTVTPREIAFVRTNYSVDGVFTVRAVDDTAVEEPQHLSLLTFQIVTDDPEYAKVVVPDKRVTVVDNEVDRSTARVGKWGGVMSLTIPYGAVILSIPAGALAGDTDLTLREWQKPLPAGDAGPIVSVGEFGELPLRRVSGTYLFTPHGTTFNTPVSIAIEYDEAAAVTAGAKLYLLVSFNNTQGPWSVVEGATFADGVASVRSSHFSTYYVAAGATAPPPAEARPPPPPPAPCLGPDSGVSDVEWGIISAFIIENLVLAAVGAWLCAKKAATPNRQVLPMQIQYNQDGKPLALPAPMGIVPGAGAGGGGGKGGGGGAAFGKGAGSAAAYNRAAMGMSHEPVVLPGPYDGQPTLAPKLAGL